MAPVNFNNDNNFDQDLYNGFIRESIEMYGVDVIFYPIWEYDTEDDVFWGEDDIPRYRKGFSVKAYYEMPEDDTIVFDKLPVRYDENFEIKVSKDAFHAALPKSLKEYDLQGPKEGDWIGTTYGEERNYVVTSVNEDWLFGQYQSYSIMVEPRRYAGEDINVGEGYEVIDSEGCSSPTGVTVSGDFETEVPGTCGMGTSGTQDEDIPGNYPQATEEFISDPDQDLSDEIEEEDDLIIEKPREFWNEW